MSYHHDILQKYLVQSYFQIENMGAAYIKEFQIYLSALFYGQDLLVCDGLGQNWFSLELKIYKIATKDLKQKHSLPE
jgi:hypothetical protein